jgi:pSer/pThr/pTyr-binding forkhead associated (FHA) protein
MTTISVGRSPENQIVIDDISISRNHAKIEVENTNRVFITDLSKNGTYVNGQRLFVNLRKQLVRSDIVNFAQVANLDWSQIPQPINLETVINQQVPPVLQGGYQEQLKPVQKQQNFEPLDFLQVVISFFVPFYGIVLYFRFLNSAPKKSKHAITAALFGLGVGVVILFTRN